MSGKRRFDDSSSGDPASKRLQSASGAPAPSPGQIQQDAVRALLEKTKRAIELKKAGMQLGAAAQAQAPAPAAAVASSTAVPGAASGLDLQAMQAKVAMQKAAVAARLAALRTSGVIPTAPGAQPYLVPQMYGGQQEQRPQKLIFKDGKMVDAAGNEVKMVKRAAEFKANQEELARIAAQVEEQVEDDTPMNFDERIAVTAKPRERRGFKFHNRGDFVSMASKQRAKAQLEKLQEEIAKASKRTGISSAAKLAMIAPFKNDTEDLVVPDVEWWDAIVLANKNYGDIEKNIPDERKFKNITHLIQHPIPLKAPTEPTKEPELKVMLTKAERKKIRSQRRKAEEREKQEKIRLGLMDAPAPKVSKSNFMRILTNDAVADPTQIEALVKKQMDIRQKNHQKANSDRALTKDQKKAKMVKKLKEDTAHEVHVAVFRVNELEGNQKFKVEMNAKQYYLTGVLIRAREQEGLNLIVVEGGPKGIKHYKKLMLRRIKWSKDDDQDDEDEDDEDEEITKKKSNKCVLVWEGTAAKPAFNSFDVKNARTEGFARDFFHKHGVPQYWDMALSDQIIEEAV